MAGWAVAILYVALFLNWFGMASGSCTMSADHQSITGIVFSAPFYLLGLCLAWFAKPGGGAKCFSLPLWPAAVGVGYWAVGLFVNTNINGQSSCTWKIGDDYGPLRDSRDLWFAPMYFLATSH